MALDRRRGAAPRWSSILLGYTPPTAPLGSTTKNRQASPALAPCGNNNLDSRAIKRTMLLIARGLQQRMTEHPAPATQAGQAQVGQTQPY